MRLGFDARLLAEKNLSGPGQYLSGLLRELGKRGLEMVLFHEPDKPILEERLGDTYVKRVAVPTISKKLWTQASLPFALKKEKIDVFHAPNGKGVPVYLPIPAVVTIHSSVPQSFYDLVIQGVLQPPVSNYIGYDFDPEKWSLKQAMHDSQFRRAHSVFVPSAFCRGEVIKFYGLNPSNIAITPSGIDSLFFKKPNTPQDRDKTLLNYGIKKPFFIYTGNFDIHRNVTGLFQAFGNCKKTNKSLQLVINSYEKIQPEILQRLHQFGIRQDHDIVPLTNIGEDIIDIYDEASAFTCLAWRESFPLPALQASARGLRVVLSRFGASEEILGKHQFFVDPTHLLEVSQTLLQMISLGPTDQEFRQTCTENAKRFRWVDTANQTLEVYRSVLDDEG